MIIICIDKAGKKVDTDIPLDEMEVSIMKTFVQSGVMTEKEYKQELKKAKEGIASDFFLLRQQLSLDVRTLPRVLIGEPYDGYLDAAS